MKRKIFTLLTASIFIGMFSQAQIKKGSVLLGGQLGFVTSKTKYEGTERKSTGFSLSPSVAKAVKDNLFIGVDALYINNKQESVSGDYKDYSFGAGFFVRRYWEVANRFYLFGQGRLGASFIKQESPGGADYIVERKGYNIGAGFYPGISFAVSKKVHLETGFNDLVSINFRHDKVRNKYGATTSNDAKTNTFGISSNLNNGTDITLGVKVLLSK